MNTDIIRGTFSSLEKKNEFQLEFDFAEARWQKNSNIYNNKPGEKKLEHILHWEPKDYHIDYVISMELPCR